MSAPAAGITPVLVTYNSERVLPWSLPALRHCADVVVVDNASSDATVARARELLPQARVIEPGRNLGFGRANNLGLAAVRTTHALLLNPDARLEDGALPALQAAAARWPEAAILAPVLWDAPGVMGDFYRGRSAARGRPALPAGDCCTEFVTGAAMLINLERMRDVGFFDPWFFLYFEDDDLCRRVRQAGHPIMVAAAANVEHHVRQSSPSTARTVFRRFYCMTLSKLYLIRKVSGGRAWITTALRIAAGSLFSLPLAALGANRERLLRHAARLAAATMAWRHLPRQHCFEPND